MMFQNICFFHSLILYLSMALGELSGLPALLTFWSLLECMVNRYPLIIFIYYTMQNIISLHSIYLNILPKETTYNHPLFSRSWLFFLAAITFCSMAVSILLYTFGLQFPESTFGNYVIFITTVLLLVILFLVYALYNYNNKRNSDLLQLKLQLQKSKILRNITPHWFHRTLPAGHWSMTSGIICFPFPS